jgi:hypothetical protein
MAPSQTFFTLRYKEKQVRQGLILASSAARAELVGKKFCALQPGRVFISVEAAVLADESILTSILTDAAPAADAPADAPPVKPTAEEQRNGLERNAAARRAGEPAQAAR